MLGTSVAAQEEVVGFVGLGRMGSAMVDNLVAAGRRVAIYDANPSAIDALKAQHGSDNVRPMKSASEVAEESRIVVSMLPNDAALKAVTGEGSDFLGALRGDHVHVSCSTVAPQTSRELAHLHDERASARFVGAPVFARPDGIAKRQAYFMLGGEAGATKEAVNVLSTTSPNCYVLGDDPGAGNVLKLSGNFLIACTIEALAESLAMAEANGIDRVQASEILTSTIFDCIIYKGYGQRVSERDHRPGGFALDLGYKDVSLALATAEKAGVAMPFGSVLKDRFVSAMARGRSDLDWSAIALQSSEDAGVEIKEAIERARDPSHQEG